MKHGHHSILSLKECYGHKITSHHRDLHVSHHGGSHRTHHGGSPMTHHGGSHIIHHGGSYLSNHGGSHLSHHRKSPMAHHGGSHMIHHGGSHVSNHGGSHLSNQGGSNQSHHGSSYLSHHGGSHLSHHGGSHLPQYGGSNITHHGGWHISPHEGYQKSHHGSSHMAHHGGFHTSHHGVSHMPYHGGSYKSHHGGSHMSLHGSSHLSHHGGSHMSHHGHMVHNGALHPSHHRGARISHHGETACKGVSISKYSHSSHGYDSASGYGDYGHGSHLSSSGGHSGWKYNGLLSNNGKETMQILNSRLSSYLDKVRSLEQENAQLEKKICEWYENNQPRIPPDATQYFKIINDLQNQIAAVTVENAKLILQIDTARLASADFKSKYEMELSLSSNVQRDVNSLRTILDGLNRENNDLEMQVQCLQEEIQQMKMNNEEEVNSLRAQLGARVNVEMNAAPSADLNRALSEIREQYENLMERNLREVESMFQQRSEDLNREVMTGSEQLESSSSELIELKRCVQTLEIELQSQRSMTTALECTLAETQATYASQLGQLQDMINSVEGQLSQIRCELERQNQEYARLMDQKNHLELEIATYKRLLDGHDIQASGQDQTCENNETNNSVECPTSEHDHHESS